MTRRPGTAWEWMTEHILFFRYCPLARMLYLLPWNRQEDFSVEFVARVFLSPPVEGRFRPILPAA